MCKTVLEAQYAPNSKTTPPLHSTVVYSTQEAALRLSHTKSSRLREPPQRGVATGARALIPEPQHRARCVAKPSSWDKMVLYNIGGKLHKHSFLHSVRASLKRLEVCDRSPRAPRSKVGLLQAAARACRRPTSSRCGEPSRWRTFA
jgi:hypothetical protein